MLKNEIDGTNMRLLEPVKDYGGKKIILYQDFVNVWKRICGVKSREDKNG